MNFRKRGRKEKLEAQCRVEAAAGGRLKGPAVLLLFLAFSFFSFAAEARSSRRSFRLFVLLPPNVLSLCVRLQQKTKGYDHFYRTTIFLAIKHAVVNY